MSIKCLLPSPMLLIPPGHVHDISKVPENVEVLIKYRTQLFLFLKMTVVIMPRLPSGPDDKYKPRSSDAKARKHSIHFVDFYHF